MQTITSSVVVARVGAPAAQQRGRTAVPKASCSLTGRRAACFGGAQTVSVAAHAASRPAARATSVQVTAMARFQTERTYIMIKPDGVQRGLVGEIISRFENKGFVLKGLKMFQTPKELAQEHYKDLSAKPFFKDLVDYIVSGPVICMVWEGVGAVKAARNIIGATNPTEARYLFSVTAAAEAAAGTIRGDLAVEVGRNVVHGSDSPENGEREIALWFKGDKLCEWTPANEKWVREL